MWSNENTRIEVNGKVVLIGPECHVELITNSNGVVSISQETQMISVPELYVSFLSDKEIYSGPPLGEEAVLTISQYAPVEKAFKNIDGNNLMNAKKADGNPLLSEEYRTQETADSIASALKECVGLINSPEINGISEGSTGYGFSWIKSNELKSYKKVKLTNTLRNNGGWSLKKDGGKVVYSTKSTEEIQQLLSMSKNQVDTLTGWKIFKRIGDLLRAVAEKVVEIVEVVVTVVEDVVTTVIKYIKDKVEQIFTGIVNTVQAVWDVVESIFNEVAVFFKDVYEWIGFIFNWGDILRTKQMYDYCTDELFTVATNTLDYLAGKIDDSFDVFKNNISAAFDDVVKKIDSSTSVGKALKGPDNIASMQNEMYKYELSNNFLYVQYSERDVPYLQSNKDFLLESDSINNDAIDEFMKILKEVTESVTDNKAFKEAYIYFSNMFSGRDNMFDMMLCGLLKVFEGVAIVAISAAEAVIKSLLLLCKTLVDTLKSLMTAEIKIPFLSTLFSTITDGDKLSVCGVCNLIMALPSTIIYKVIKKKAPIADEAEFDEFKKWVNADVITKAITGQTNKLKDVENHEGKGLAPEWVQSLLNSTCAISSCVYYMTSSKADVDSVISGELTPLSVNLASFGCEAIWFFASIPYWSTSPSTAELVNCGFVGGGLLLDAIFLIYDRVMPENSDAEWPKYVTVIYGILFEAAGICALAMPSKKPGVSDYILNIVPPIICMSKIGLTRLLVEPTETISAQVVVISEQITGIAIAITYFVAAGNCGEKAIDFNNTLEIIL